MIILSGKLYYELVKERNTRGLDEKVALIRIEELCPLPRGEVMRELGKFKHVTDLVWAQEEPQNAGAWMHVEPRLRPLLPIGHELRYVGRSTLPAPAVGTAVMHKQEVTKLYEDCFAGL